MPPPAHMIASGEDRVDRADVGGGCVDMAVVGGGVGHMHSGHSVGVGGA